MTIQKTYWGYIDWLYTNNVGRPGQSMNNIGICVILPGQRQYQHVHYGEEQFMYMLEGESVQIVNGVEHTLSKGMHMLMKAGVCHESVNTGEIPVLQLLVSTPVADYRQIEVTASSNDTVKAKPGFEGNIYAAVESLRSQLADSFQAPFALFDSQAKLILQNNLYPQFCGEKCRPYEAPFECECLAAKEETMSAEQNYFWLACRYGLLVYHLPIVFRNQTLGYIRGGHILCSDISGKLDLHGVYDTPKGTALGIINMLKQVVKSVAAYCEFDATRLEIEFKNQELTERNQQKKILEHSLRATRDTVTNLKISRHFLFNTLNCMAGMAVQKQVDGLYSAILSLSRLFRYAMPSDRSFVTLKEELNYLDDYLKLQQFRYGEALQILWTVEVDPKRFQVPFNFLQPVVENAFTHGFIDRDNEMLIEIVIRKCPNFLELNICNNGDAINESTLLRIKKGLSSNSGHGLSLIYNKLQSAYGGDFEMDILSKVNTMTCVKMRLPIKWVGPASGSYGIASVLS